MSKLTVARALSARIASRMVLIATFVAFGLYGVIAAATALLAYLYSPWWWLLLLPFTVALIVFLLLRLVVKIVIRRIHTERMTHQQTDAMDAFVDKIQQLLEARATPLPIFALITMKDILLYRDARTVKKLVSDTAGLSREFEALEKLF